MIPSPSQTAGTAAFSYLEFGAIDPVACNKTVWDFRTGDTAYDWFMLARYANDLAAYQQMSSNMSEYCLEELISRYSKDIHHADDFSVNLGKFLALGIVSVHHSPVSFFELGQTLFGCIEGMTFCKELMKRLEVNFPQIDLHLVNWSGLDISALFNQLAPMLHSCYHIKTCDEIEQLESHYGVFFAKGVSLLYAVRSIESLFNLLDRCELSLFDYSLSLENEQHVIIGTGKPVVYLSLESFLAACRISGKVVYLKRGNSSVDRATGRVWIDAVYGREELCQNYIACDCRVRGTLTTRLEGLAAERLLDNANGRNSGWITLENFLAEAGVFWEVNLDDN